MKGLVERVKRQSDFIRAASSGIIISGIGALAIWEGTQHPIGSLTAMGPGYLPIAVGAVLALLGLAVAIEGLLTSEEQANCESRPASIRTIASILGGLLAFALTVDRFGVVPATFALVFINSFAQHGSRFLTNFLLASGLSLVAIVVFIYGLGLPIRAFAW